MATGGGGGGGGRGSAKPRCVVKITANGVSYGRLFHTERVSLGGVTAHRVPAVIMKDGLGDIDGLLGMSFLSRFSVHIDHGAGAMTLSQR